MSNKVHGTSFGGEHLSLNLDFYTITTAVNILATTFGDVNQIALDRLVEIVSINGQPVIMTPPSLNAGVYTLKFAIEHTGAWIDAPTLLAAIKANSPASMGFTGDTTMTVTIASSF